MKSIQLERRGGPVALEKIKPCPHCGGKARADEGDSPPGQDSYFVIVCSVCGCKSRFGGTGTKAQTIAIWNKRVKG